MTVLLDNTACFNTHTHSTEKQQGLLRNMHEHLDGNTASTATMCTS
jgi:hypothetical protein